MARLFWLQCAMLDLWRPAFQIEIDLVCVRTALMSSRPLTPNDEASAKTDRPMLRWGTVAKW